MVEAEIADLIAVSLTATEISAVLSLTVLAIILVEPGEAAVTISLFLALSIRAMFESSTVQVMVLSKTPKGRIEAFISCCSPG